jgi:uncharacterized C2H2 Zn-finger protein
MMMRKKHKIMVEMELRCPRESCGHIFKKRFFIEYITNQKGDIIEKKIT